MLKYPFVSTLLSAGCGGGREVIELAERGSGGGLRLPVSTPGGGEYDILLGPDAGRAAQPAGRAIAEWRYRHHQR